MNWKTNKKLPRKHYKSVEVKKKLRDVKDRTRSSIYLIRVLKEKS